MARVKRGTQRTKKRKKVLKETKGYKWRRKNTYKLAKDANRHAMANAYVGRKQKKRNMRQLWQIKINAAARQNGTTYSKFIHALKQNKVELDRKVLAELAEHEPETFEKVVESVK
ncbi:MAG: 50S ribosomal protein L20 [Candidatus Spechtbacterales bacterium]|nr:50S ribosomal protein L20 [Candidatus Spechtbacterales bacterium]